MNKDVLGIIERYILRYNIEQINKQHRKICRYCDDFQRLLYKPYENTYPDEVDYNYRYFDYYGWTVIDIYDIHYRKIAQLSKNY